MGEYIDVLGRPVGLSLDRLKRLLEQDPKQSLFSRGIPDSILSLNLQSKYAFRSSIISQHGQRTRPTKSTGTTPWRT